MPGTCGCMLCSFTATATLNCKCLPLLPLNRLYHWWSICTAMTRVTLKSVYLASVFSQFLRLKESQTRINTIVFVQYNIANCTIMVKGVGMTREITSLNVPNNNGTVLDKTKQAMRLIQNTFKFCYGI